MKRLALLVIAGSVLALSGCGGSSSTGTPPPPTTGVSFGGKVYGGQQPVSGAVISFYAAGTSGYGSSGTSLMASQVTTDANGSFTITGSYSCPSSSTPVYLVSRGGNPGLKAGTNNAAIVLIAPIGACGNLTTSTQIIIDEATSAASVWALSAFLSPGANIGSSATNSSGLTNAMSTALSLANTTTGLAPGTTSPANATVQTAKLNTLANILGACVNSDPAQSNTCSSLMSAATPSGSSAPTNTLDAALNIVRNPASNVATLYQIGSATPLFQPSLASAPADWTMGISYTGGGLSDPAALAIDSSSNVWIANYFSTVSEFSSLGQPLSASGFTGSGLYESYGLTVDGSSNVWITNQQSPGSVNSGLGSVTKFTSAGQSLSGANGFIAGGINFPIAAAADANGNVWVVNYGDSSVTVLSSAGASLSGSNGFAHAQLAFPVAVAVDASHNGWIANQGSSNITKVSADGTQVNNYSCCNGASSLAIDQKGNVWAANYYGSSISEITSSGTVPLNGQTGGGLNHPQAIAVDGAGTVWVANYRGNSLSEFMGASTATPGTPLSPAAGLGTDVALSEPFGIAIDASGNLWVSNAGNNTLVEYVGVAAPVKTPLLGPAQLP